MKRIPIMRSHCVHWVIPQMLSTISWIENTTFTDSSAPASKRLQRAQPAATQAHVEHLARNARSLVDQRPWRAVHVKALIHAPVPSARASAVACPAPADGQTCHGYRTRPFERRELLPPICSFGQTSAERRENETPPSTYATCMPTSTSEISWLFYGETQGLGNSSDATAKPRV